MINFKSLGVNIIKNINKIMREGWSFSAACGELKIDPRKLKTQLTPEEFAVLNNMRKHYDFYRTITPLDCKMPDFFKDSKETAH